MTSRRVGLLLVFIIFVVVGAVFYVKQVRPITKYWSLVSTVSDEIYSFHQKRPADVDVKQWKEAVGWTMNIYGNVTMMQDECDIAFLRRFHVSLREQFKRGVDLETLKWIWDELSKAGPRAADYAHTWRPVRLMASEPITDESLPTLWGIDDCRELDLYGADISDDGLEYLNRLKNVRLIRLDSTDVTQDGVANLQKALPNCEVFHPEFSTQVTQHRTNAAASGTPSP